MTSLIVLIVVLLTFALFLMLIRSADRAGGEHVPRSTRRKLTVAKDIVREVERLLVEDERVPFLSQDRRELLQGLVDRYHTLD